ncbi:MAG: ATP-dependent helicase [Treponema sp.]|nr:ATP-dependent helicase [Treponema sp.]
MSQSYLDVLNSEQKRAVLHTGKPLLILAGAGSGKTRVITTKIAWLIREQGLDPRSILAVTFTNKAAREMAERAKLIDDRAGDAMLRTFHSFGAWFLRRNGPLAGLDSGFVIYDDDDVCSLLSSLMENSTKAEIKQIAYKISRAKDYFLCPNDPKLSFIDSHKKFHSIYAMYEERMSQIGNVDFGDLIKKPVEILRSHPETAQRFRDRFSAILVDEYQDANVAQFELLKELTGPATYVCVVGDDDQSIYRFRGAEVKNILEFPNLFSGTEIIRLEKNYRSTEPILRAASSVVDNNQGRLGKTLSATRGNGKLPVLAFLPNQDEEAAFCARQIEDSVRQGRAKWSHWAILYRTNAQSLGFETKFLRRGIPYRVVGSLKFYEREEIKDALALLSFLVNPRDEVAFRRIVNKPARGVGPASVDKIIEAAYANENDLMETGRRIDLAPKARAGLNDFIKLIEDGKSLLENAQTTDEEIRKLQIKKRDSNKSREGLASGEGFSNCVYMLVKNSGIADYHKMQDDVTGNQRLNNLQELLNAASQYPLSQKGLQDFLEHIELDRSLVNDSADTGNVDSVTLITFHNTKGLEFQNVIMTGVEHGVFPRENIKEDELEEERRLFYVGATRAMNELYFTSCAMRRMYGRTVPTNPSLFLHEVDKGSLQITGSIPYGFNTLKKNAASPGHSEIEKAADWKRGESLYHDDHGYGEVIAVTDSEEGPVVRVHFQTGKELHFHSEYQGSAITKIGRDY